MTTHPAPGDHPERLVDSSEAARLLGITERHVRRLVAERRIAFVKVGSFVRFKRGDLDRFIDDGYVAREA